MFPKELRYAPTHEWSRLEGDQCTVGITQFAVEQLTDVVHMELAAAGTRVEAGKRFGEIESVKSVNDLYAPVAGEIAAVNTKLAADPAPVSADPYGQGWMVKIRVAPGTSLDHLLTAEQYEQQIAAEGH
jgi:glycine cleavage system H protein